MKKSAKKKPEWAEVRELTRVETARRCAKIARDIGRKIAFSNPHAALANDIAEAIERTEGLEPEDRP